MSEPIKSGGPAFPFRETEDDVAGSRGMTLRDWFAGQAMNGWLSRIACNQEAEDLLKKAGIQPSEFESTIAGLCYDMADAMVVAREGRAA